MQDLALQVAGVHDVEIHEPQRPDPRRRQVERRRRSQSSGPDEQDPPRLEPPLPLGTHFGQNQVPRVAQDLVV